MLLRFLINQSIVKTIFGNMFLHPDDVDGVKQSRNVILFIWPDEESQESKNEQEGIRDLYSVKIKRTRRFRLDSRLIALGDSLCSVSGQLQVIRKEPRIAAYSGASEATWSNYNKVFMVVCFQKLAELLKNIWAAFIAFHCSTHQGRSYLDVILRVIWNSRLWNFHLISLLMFERHTG